MQEVHAGIIAEKNKVHVQITVVVLAFAAKKGYSEMVVEMLGQTKNIHVPLALD